MNRERLLRRGRALEYATLAWNTVGIVVLGLGAIMARSIALAGFGLDSLIEIGASVVVLWQLRDTARPGRERRSVRLIGIGFVALAAYLVALTVSALAAGSRPAPSPLGIVWTALTVVVMLALALGKARTGRAMDNPVLRGEGRVTLIDALLAAAVLTGLALNAALGWWWADPLAGLALFGYALVEARAALRSSQ